MNYFWLQQNKLKIGIDPSNLSPFDAKSSSVSLRSHLLEAICLQQKIRWSWNIPKQQQQQKRQFYGIPFEHQNSKEANTRVT